MTRTMTRTIQNNDDNHGLTTQQSTRRRIRRRGTITASASLLMLVVGCITISCCAAFNIVPPYSNRAVVIRGLHATTEEDVSSKTESSSPPPPLQTYDRQEFEMQVGRAMDTLRDDYPDILVKDPNYSIYHPDLELIDPSGVHLHGVKNYENAIRLVHTMVGIFYCPDQSDMKFRMCFDKARQNIRIHWNARVVPKAIFGGTKTTLHVDGISIYELDRQSGNITQHRLERLVMNDDQVSPEQGVFAALRRHAINSQVDGIPSFHRHMEAMTKIGGSRSSIIRSNIINNNIVNNPIFENGGEVNIQTHKFPDNVLRFQNNINRGSVLFGDLINDDYHHSSSSALLKSSFVTASSSHSRLNSVSSSAAEADGSISHMDASMADGLEKKNIARKKFGLKPLDMEEFVEIEKQVKELETNQQQKKVAAAAVKAMELERAKQEKENSAGGFLGKLFGNALKDTCESNYDCIDPEVCCDFKIKKMCCTSGTRVVNGIQNGNRQRQLSPVPIENPNPYPGNDPRNRDRIYQ